MKQNKVNYLISTMLVTYGTFTALITVFLQYIPYYTTVLAPVPYRRGYLRPMVLIGLLVFAAIVALSFAIRKKFELSPYLAGVPALLFGGLVFLIPLATPTGLSDLLAKKVHWLTPTIVGNGLLAAYVCFVLIMALGAVTVTTVSFRHAYTYKRDRAAIIGYPLLFLLLGLTSAAILVLLPDKIGFDRTFQLAGIICAVCALVSLALGWKKAKWEV